MGFATKVKEGGDFKPFPRGLKDGTNRRRVLPGIHSCSESGEWAKKYSTHTYKIPREDDPEKFDYVTFHCVEVVDWVNREKVVLETCPECVLIADQNDEFTKLQTKLKEELKSGQKTKDEVRKLLRPFIEWKKRHGRSFWWAVNVKDPDSKYFTEKWPNDVKKQYDAEKKKLKDEENLGAILPIEEGAWFDIIKTPGNETDTGFPKYRVEVTMERVGDGGMKRIKKAPLTEAEADEAEKSCWDISDPGIVTLTRDQVKALAASGDAPAVVRGIFKQSQKVSTPSKSTSTPKADSKPATPPAPKAETPPAPKTEAPPKVETASVESEEDREYRLAQEAVARAAARREAARKAQTGGAGPLPPKTETPPKVETPPAEPPKVETKSETKSETKKGGDDDDIDAFMNKYGLGEDEPE